MAAAPSYLGLGITTAWHLSATSTRGDYSVLTSKGVCLTWVWRCAGRASPWSSLAVLSLPHRLFLLSAATQLAAGNSDACNRGSARSDVHTGKHSLVWIHTRKRTHAFTKTQHCGSIFSLLILAEFVLLSESLPLLQPLLRAKPSSVNAWNRLNCYPWTDACKKKPLHMSLILHISTIQRIGHLQPKWTQLGHDTYKHTVFSLKPLKQLYPENEQPAV